MLLEQAQDARRVGPHDRIHLLAILEQDKGGHGADAELLGEFGQVVDVKLCKVDLVLPGLLLGPPVEK